MLTPLVLSCFLILKRVQVLQTYRIYIIDHIFYASEANHQFEHDIYVNRNGPKMLFHDQEC